MSTPPTSPVRIQAHAFVLIVNDASLTITAASENTEAYGWPAADRLIGTDLQDHLSPAVVEEVLGYRDQPRPSIIALDTREDWVGVNDQIIVHHFAGEFVLEFEAHREWSHSDDYTARLNKFTQELEEAPDAETLLQRLCDGILYHFDCNRVLLLQFDEQANGLVTQEARTSGMPAFLNVHFTRDDVPNEARYKQTVQPVYCFSNVNTPLSEVVGEYGAAAKEVMRYHLACRSPNENFTDFLRDSDLSCIGYLSIILEGELYASVYFHVRRPLYLDYQMRAFLLTVGRLVQQRITVFNYSQAIRLRSEANLVRDRLQEYIINSENLQEGLTSGEVNLLHIMDDTHGAAICSEDTLYLFEETPGGEAVNGIFDYIKREHGGNELFFTDNLGELFPPAREFLHLAAGLLYLPLDAKANQWIIWFKPEVTQTVTYGSAAEKDQIGNARRRFYVHVNTRHGYSLPWNNDDIGGARAMQIFLQEIVMQRYADTKRRNMLLREAYEDLETFSYTVGHDLRAPLRAIAGFTDILKEDFSETLGEEGRKYLRHIEKNARQMQMFMDDLLALSRIDRKQLSVAELSVDDLVQNVLENRIASDDKAFTCQVQKDLPPIRGDESHLLTVFTNLISNAIKYCSETEPPCIEIGLSKHRRNGNPVFYVSDNGIGIPEEQYERVFDLFSRSPNADGYSGTGIGLALVRRILRLHEGEIWVESEVGKGSRFYFYTSPKAS